MASPRRALGEERTEFGLVVGARNLLARADFDVEFGVHEAVDRPAAEPGERGEVVDVVAVLEALCLGARDGRDTVVAAGAVSDGVEPLAGDSLQGVLVDVLDAVSG